MDKIIKGLRFKDGKLRSIFMDSFANYYREARVFKRMFDWVFAQPWNHKYPIMTLAKIIIMSKPKSAYAGDYKGMDMHTIYDAAATSANMLCDVCHANLDARQEVCDVLYEVYEADLLVGHSLVMGESALKSGLYPTHDIESPMNFGILGKTADIEGFEVVPPGTPLKKNQCTIIVCGDDSIVLFGRKLTKEELEHFGTTHARVAAWFGQIVELDKLDYGWDTITFCKRTFALHQSVAGYKYLNIDGIQVPVPKYDCLKALNGLRNPEHIPAFPNKTGLLIWLCAVMDNAFGSNQWKSTVIALIQKNPQLVEIIPDEIDPETRQVLNKDWWMANYVKFDLKTSPTYALIKRYMTSR
jgi:hypothetical protein